MVDYFYECPSQTLTMSKVCSENVIMHKATRGSASQLEILAVWSQVELRLSLGLIVGICMCLSMYSENYKPTVAG